LTGLKNVILIASLLLLTAGGVLADEETGDTPTREPRADKNATFSDQHSVRDIPCNWSGWKNSFPEVKCSYNRCERNREVLSMKCLDGFVTEVKTARVCAGCEIF
jgi:hypothetical protein